jgi:tetratricopeptide (TPR) repeat protein
MNVEKMAMNFRITALFMLISTLGVAQVNYQQQYTNAKNLFKEGKYNLAMESFKAIIPYDKNNTFSEYASFYYSISAYNQGYKSVARDMFNQIKQLYPAWDQLNEVNLWLARIHFENKEYFQALNVLQSIRDQKLETDINALKRFGFSGVEDVDLLKRLHEDYPKDAIIGERLAAVLANDINSEADKELLEKLITTFKLKRDEYIEATPETVYKDTYSVSLLFPFLVNSLDPSPSRKRNQFVLDLYEGMKLAVDTLAKQGIKISLRAYDTERNPDKIKSILGRDELKATDLIVGPLFQEENALVQDFSRLYRINLFNPVSNNFDLVRENPYGFLFQPSLETLGEQSAYMLDRQLTNKKCMIFLGDTRRDSTLAMSFIEAAKATNLKIIQIEKFSRESSGRILSILATPTEYDEFKYPKQFTLPKDSLGCVFVASDDPLIYSKVISSVTTRGDGVTIVGNETWLDQTTDYEKFQSLNILMTAPTFTYTDRPAYVAFQKKFIRTHGRTPGIASQNYAKIGYDFMLFAGTMLKKHGVYFQNGFSRGIIPGFLFFGYDFRYNRNNQLVNFIRVKEGELVKVDPGFTSR